MMHQIVMYLTSAIGEYGYAGILMLMALESSFFPFPSEVVIPPAAYLAATGQMNLGIVILSGSLGSLLGALFNYWLAARFGRPFLEKHGRLFLVSPGSLEKAERFFDRHGHISMFTGRLLPVIRQYISLPAGLARMNIFTFCASTFLGAAVWVVILAASGYWFGRNEQLVLQNLRWITVCISVGCGIVILVYLKKWRQRHSISK